MFGEPVHTLTRRTCRVTCEPVAPSTMYSVVWLASRSMPMQVPLLSTVTVKSLSPGAAAVVGQTNHCLMLAVVLTAGDEVVAVSSEDDGPRIVLGAP